MEDIANPFKGIAPTFPIPVILDYTILVDDIPKDASLIKIVPTTD